MRDEDLKTLSFDFQNLTPDMHSDPIGGIEYNESNI